MCYFTSIVGFGWSWIATMCVILFSSNCFVSLASKNCKFKNTRLKQSFYIMYELIKKDKDNVFLKWMSLILLIILSTYIYIYCTLNNWKIFVTSKIPKIKSWHNLNKKSIRFKTLTLTYNKINKIKGLRQYKEKYYCQFSKHFLQ